MVTNDKKVCEGICQIWDTVNEFNVLLKVSFSLSHSFYN